MLRGESRRRGIGVVNLNRLYLRLLVSAGVVGVMLGSSNPHPSLTRASLPFRILGSGQAYVAVSASLKAYPLPSIRPSPLVPGPLDGEPTPRSLALRRPVAVTVDNFAPDARPQSGLSAASIVVETTVEGGITRLMAIYLERDATKVGPVRSTRVYFDDWASAFHAILVHVGGNDDAQALLWHLPSVYNLDESEEQFMLGDSVYYWRTDDRAVPYNMYANVKVLRRYAAAHGQNWAYSAASLPHKAPDPQSERPQSGTLTVSFVDPLYTFIPPDPDYTVRYTFDRATNTYLRIVNGAAQIDAATRRRLRAANIVVMRTGPGVADLAAGITLDSNLIPVIGSGPAQYFRDGRVLSGRWEQKDQFAPLRFLDRSGKPVDFNPGQTWIEVLPSASTATWRSR